MKSASRALVSVMIMLAALVASGPTTATPGNGQGAGNGNGNGNNGNHGNGNSGNGNGNTGGSGNGQSVGGPVVNTVPEPSTLLLSLAALGVMARIASRRSPPKSRQARD